MFLLKEFTKYPKTEDGISVKKKLGVLLEYCRRCVFGNHDV